MISFLDDCWCCRCPNIFRLFFRSKPLLSISYLGVQYLYQILSVSILTFPCIFFDLLHGGIRRIPGHSSTKGGYTVYRIPNTWHFTVTQFIKYDNVCFLKWGDPKIIRLIHIIYIYIESMEKPMVWGTRGTHILGNLQMMLILWIWRCWPSTRAVAAKGRAVRCSCWRRQNRSSRLGKVALAYTE